MLLQILLGLGLTAVGHAAPHPATSSSTFVGLDQGLFRSRHGFAIDATKTTWALAAPPVSTPNIVALYRAPSTSNGVQPALTVRTDEMNRAMSAKLYFRRWRRDYARFGFTVLRAQSVTVNGQRGFMIDLKNRNGKKQLRQVIFTRKQRAVIMTCRDHEKGFVETVKACNQLVRNFRWI